jgi:phospholipase/lecithinase/hemolysin
MTGLWLRRAFMAAACASLALVAGCGSSSVYSALKPARFVGFGDAFSDLGAGGAGRYTVNDTSTNNWTQFVSFTYGVGMSSLADGGTSRAAGNARVTATVDAAGGAAVPVTQQISNFLASGSFGPNDVVLINGGISDLIVQMQAVTSGAQSDAAMIANVEQAGRELGAQVRRLVNAGAKYVVVAGTYDLARTPWGGATGRTDLLSRASTRFNDELLLSIVDLGTNVLYVDAAYYFNLVTGNGSNYNFSNAVDPVCTSVDAGPGIGIGTGQINSSLCNTGTLANADYEKFIFADRVYPSPHMHRLFGEYAYNRIKQRW